MREKNGWLRLPLAVASGRRPPTHRLLLQKHIGSKVARQSREGNSGTRDQRRIEGDFDSYRALEASILTIRASLLEASTPVNFAAASGRRMRRTAVRPKA